MSQELAPAEQELLNEFQIITNFKEEDYDKVVKLLKNNYWNLEIGISKYFDGKLDEEAEREEEPPVVHEPIPPPQPIDLNHLNHINQFNNFNQFNVANIDHSLFKQFPIVKPISNKWRSHPGLIKQDESEKVWENPLIFLLLLIPRTLTFIINAVTGLFNFIFPSSPNSLPESATLTEFDPIKHVEDLTKDKFQLNIFEGEFNDCFNISKLENKYILLILIANNDLSNVFIKKILNNQNVIDFLNSREEITVYLGNVEEFQSFEIAQTMKIRSIPSISLIANVSNGPSGIASMSVLSKIPIRSTNSFISKITKIIELFNPEIITRKLEQEELEYSRKLRELQDKAYTDSLNLDKQKQEQKENEENAKKIKLEYEAFIKENKLKFYSSLLKKYDNENNNDTNEKITKIRFKLPNGKFITQKFTKTSTVFDIYSFIDLQIHLLSLTQEQKNELSSNDYNDEDVHGDYDHSFKFELISPFPRLIIDKSNKEKELGDIKDLWPNGNLLVEFDEEDDE